ncbi:MAG: hypothetical protein LUH15_05985 [Tannerellaceae bacterium]|nr:hypothetical protein [Tannerellaceae bacterium]
MAQINTVIFNKSKQGIEVQMLVSRNNKGLTTFTSLIKKDGKEFVLQEEQTANILFTDSNKYHFFNIFDFIVTHNELLIFYNDLGQLFVDKFIFTDDSIKNRIDSLLENIEL